MEFNKSVTNPMLVGAIQLLRAENSPENQKMLTEEIIKAHFLSPVMITPEPEKNEDGEVKIQPGSKVQFPTLTTTDGKKFLMAFTDRVELQKWKEYNGHNTFTLTFDDYANMLFRKDAEGKLSPALGFVINPFGGNVVVPKQMIATCMKAKMTAVQGLKASIKPQ